MAWIKTISQTQAEGLLAKIYDDAIKRAGKVFQIVKVQSQNPAVLRSGLGLYRDIMLVESPLPRSLREMIATVVSKTNLCHY